MLIDVYQNIHALSYVSAEVMQTLNVSTVLGNGLGRTMLELNRSTSDIVLVSKELLDSTNKRKQDYLTRWALSVVEFLVPGWCQIMLIPYLPLSRF